MKVIDWMEKMKKMEDVKNDCGCLNDLHLDREEGN